MNHEIEIIRLIERHTAAELELLETIFAEPAAGFGVASAAGITAANFFADDHRAIWAALNIGRDRAKPAVVALAKQALQLAHHWDPKQIAGNLGASSSWSDAMLAALANSWFYCPTVIIGRARKLLALSAHFDAVVVAHDALSAAIRADVPAVRPRRQVMRYRGVSIAPVTSARQPGSRRKHAAS